MSNVSYLIISNLDYHDRPWVSANSFPTYDAAEEWAKREVGNQIGVSYFIFEALHKVYKDETGEVAVSFAAETTPMTAKEERLREEDRQARQRAADEARRQYLRDNQIHLTPGEAYVTTNLNHTTWYDWGNYTGAGGFTVRATVDNARGAGTPQPARQYGEAQPAPVELQYRDMQRQAARQADLARYREAMEARPVRLDYDTGIYNE